MKNMILENIKWIFSGIGVLILATIGALVINNSKKPAPLPTAGPASITNPTINPAVSEPMETRGISPSEIITTIEAAPLLQGPEVAKHYYGVTVDWTGKLFLIRKISPTRISLGIRVFSEGRFSFLGIAVVLRFDPAPYPGLGLLKNDDHIRASGVIDEIDEGIIYLRDVKLISYGSGQK